VREDGRIVGGEGRQEKYVTDRNGRSSWEWQGIVAFCTCEWNEWMNADMDYILTSNSVDDKFRYFIKGIENRNWSVIAHLSTVFLILRCVIPIVCKTIRWGKFSQKHSYKYMAKWWCLL